MEDSLEPQLDLALVKSRPEQADLEGIFDRSKNEIAAVEVARIFPTVRDWLRRAGRRQGIRAKAQSASATRTGMKSWNRARSR